MLKNDADNNVTYNGLIWVYQIKCILDSIILYLEWPIFLETVPFTLIKINRCVPADLVLIYL